MRAATLLLVVGAACSHASSSTFKTDERQTAKLEALKKIVRAEAVTADTREVVRAAPVRTIIEEPWDEPAPTPAEPARVVHHPKRTTIERGPVETTKTRGFKRESRQDEQDASRLATERNKATSGSALSSTSVGPPRWVWVLAPVLALGLFAAIWKLKPAWLGWLT